MHIPKEIDDDEILVRFIFLDHFKKKNLRKERISSQDIFLDDRLVGISLQRGKYTTENFCKQRAKTIDNKKYVGFVLFKKGDYLEACKEFIKERNEFHSIMEFTPLDEYQRRSELIVKINKLYREFLFPSVKQKTKEEIVLDYLQKKKIQNLKKNNICKIKIIVCIFAY